MIINDWATLDKLNKNHYGRGKPEYVIEAQQKMQDASTTYDEYSEAWERGEVSGDELADVFDEYLFYVARYEKAYDTWMRSYEQQQDDNRADLQAVQ